ncbi:ABC transporter permease [Chitinophaga sp. LS1]|uniref:ABC transporter permease n=1 Tax=Chitinophaga sp. LS1 TaxID=3051176 RepID=UPI002AAC317E|nr:ABC transporter permease [Chitinophaga sp. LS1]WPV68878.1 ABC transporter permease [Chitinophaga sp. LS1]
MIRSYIRIALRNLWRNKLFSAINIGGLAIGMAISFMLMLYVLFQFSFDQFHKNVNNIYQVVTEDAGVWTTPVPLASTLEKTIPGIKTTSRASYFYAHLLQAGENSIKLTGGYVDPQYLNIFSFPVINGNVKPLNDKNEIVVTTSTAHKLFGDTNPIGQLVKLDAQDPLVVSAVVNDPPANSSIQFDYLCSWSLYAAKEQWIKDNTWGNFGIMTFVLLQPNASIATVQGKVKHVLQDAGNNNINTTLMLHAAKDWKLYNTIKDGKIIGGNIETVRLFLLLALGILLIACVNFMNLSTAQAERRAREVGVRKAIGANRRLLIFQFFGESLILVTLSTVLALLLLWILLPAFNTFANSALKLSKAPLVFWSSLPCLLLVTGLLAGSYPALYLSSFKPIKVLKGGVTKMKGNFLSRQALVVFQFGLAVVLIITTIVIYRQLYFIQHKPIGYDPKGLVDIELEGRLYDGYDAFRNAVIASGGAVEGTIVSNQITNAGSTTWGLKWPGQEAGEDQQSFGVIATAANFASTFSIPVLQGRDFLSTADSMSIMVNETALKAMHLKDPMGQVITYNGQRRTITGVVKDFVWETSYKPATPMIFTYNPDWRGVMTFKLNPALSVKASMDRLEKVYHEMNPDYPFNYTFVDDSYQKKYDNERFLSRAINIFASLAVIISCLGLLGLSVFAAEQRKKEIGIRKVMGAGVQQVMLLLSKEFLKPVLIAILIASPISAYIMNNWLQHYTYRVDIEWWMFGIAGLLAVLIALATVSIQSFRAANMNPVKALRTE